VPDSPLRVGVVFGGRSVEHDVSIITGLQACEVLAARHEPLPIYIDRDGRWQAGERDLDAYRTGSLDADPVVLDLGEGRLVSRAAPSGGVLRRRQESRAYELDVVVNATHGTQGEDGCLQGAFELADLAYTGPGVEAAAIAMDKAATKAVLRDAGIPVLGGVTLHREAWTADRDAVVREALDAVPLPAYAKPASLGSSIGVARCATEEELREALELAFELDRKAIVEPSVEGGTEVNCAVLGRPRATARASVCEQPLSGDGNFLSFEDKYLREGGKGGAAAKGDGGAEQQAGTKGAGMASASRVIPAPIGDERTADVQRLAIATFEALGCAGVARIDLLLDADGGMVVNECNTIPGSFSFYLFEPAGLPFDALMDEMIDLALAERDERRRTVRTFETNLLAARGGAAKA
jgi:D-alanine-D-alanine ligase